MIRSSLQHKSVIQTTPETGFVIWYRCNINLIKGIIKSRLKDISGQKSGCFVVIQF
jgi:hypothetical protein